MNTIHLNNFCLVVLVYKLYSSIVASALKPSKESQADLKSNNQVSSLLEKQELFQVTNYHYNTSMGLSLVKAFIRDESLQVESQGNDTEDHCKRCLSYLLWDWWGNNFTQKFLMLQARHEVGCALWFEVEANESSILCAKDSLRHFASYLDDFNSILTTDLVYSLSPLENILPTLPYSHLKWLHINPQPQLLKKPIHHQAWWYTLIILVLRRLQQEDWAQGKPGLNIKYKASLYKLRPCLRMVPLLPKITISLWLDGT